MNDRAAVGDFVQASRVLKISSPLGKNVLLPEKARISEGVNQLFDIEIAVRAKRDIKPEELIGAPVDYRDRGRTGRGWLSQRLPAIQWPGQRTP